MTIFDISMAVSSVMVAWPGTTIPVVEWEMLLSRGDIADVSRWTLGAHSGTHVDAPSHFLPGAPGLDGVPLDALVGPARVVELPDSVTSIHPEDVSAMGIAGVERVLFKTSNSRRRLDSPVFDETYVGLEAAAAQLLVEWGVRMIGTDYLSIEPFGRPTFAAHHVLLGAGVAIVEGLDLRAVEPGDYRVTVLPLRLEGAEAAPARAILEGPLP